MKGNFIVFEGPDGAGKSTVANHVAKALEISGYDVLLTREPGGIQAAEDIRKILKSYKLNSIQQTMLFMTSMNMNIEQVIKPALENGKLVICDRYLRSTYIYQGYADIASIIKSVRKKSWFYKLSKWACYDLLPDCEIIIDVDPNIAWKRIHHKDEPMDAIESKGKEFMDHINERYKATYKNIPGWNYPQFKIFNSNVELSSVVYSSIAIILESIGVNKPLQEAEKIFNLYKENIDE